MQGIQVGIRIECQRHSLIEALGTHSALELIAAVLVSRQAPGGDLGSFQEGGGDMVIAIFTDHFLGQVRLADLDILAVARSNHLHGVTVGFHRQS